MKHYNIVAAVIHHQGKFLCMQKGKTKHPYTSYKYEFPGGKIEKGESPEEALHRELIEEMGYEISIKNKLTTIHHSYPDFEITMQVFLCEVTTTAFFMYEHIAFQWLKAKDLYKLDWADADFSIIEIILALKK